MGLYRNFDGFHFNALLCEVFLQLNHLALQCCLDRLIFCDEVCRDHTVLGCHLNVQGSQALRMQLHFQIRAVRLYGYFHVIHDLTHDILCVYWSCFLSLCCLL